MTGGGEGARLAVITPTGDRPLAFSLCRRWMAAQTRPPDQWIVVDDGRTPMAETDRAGLTYVRREPSADDPPQTVSANISAAVPRVDAEHIVIIEDDDYYAPSYLATMADRLRSHPVVGMIGALYYHLPSGGYWKMGNFMHASLAQTAFNVRVLADLIPSLRHNFKFLDIEIWRMAWAGRNNYGEPLLFSDVEPPIFCGIKGLPGRRGVVGHDAGSYVNFDTPDRTLLRRWIPTDYQIYLDLLQTWNAGR